MRTYAVRRLLLLIPTLVLISILVFLSVRFIPGDVVEIMAAQMSQASAQGQPISPEYLRHMLGLDKPIWYQYALYLWHLLHANLGYSYNTQLPVTQSILQRFPATVMIAAFLPRHPAAVRRHTRAR